VHATTKPLLGLFNNRPHFTRALDPSLSRVAHAEFRVAGKGSERDPWFELDLADHAWLAQRLGVEGRIGAEQLRRAVMRFLMRFTHRPNPAVIGRRGFEAQERAGARLFLQRCAGCHAPRASADDPSSSVPFERWEPLVFDPRGALVWASAERHKTGVEPYVHARGARTSSLRRLHKKRPYFTNGSIRGIAELLEAARFDGNAFWHQGAPPDASAFDPAERAALRAFLQLL
jgi:hypothetical protein